MHFELEELKCRYSGFMQEKENQAIKREKRFEHKVLKERIRDDEAKRRKQKEELPK